MVFRMKRPRSALAALLVATFVVIFFVRLDTESSITLNPSGHTGVSRDKFYTELFAALHEYRPEEPPEDINSVTRSDTCDWPGDVSVRDFAKAPKLSYTNLRACYALPARIVRSLHAAHSSFVTKMRKSFNPSPANIQSWFTGGRGIVTVGGDRFSVLLLTMIIRLRRTGTTLPIEVIIPPQDEGDDDFCNNFLPHYNARCVFFKDVLPANVVDNFPISRFQIKSLGLILSSFKEIIYIDADSYPIKNLDHVFDTTAYKDKGLIMWPDIWRRFTAPDFYEIANVELNTKKRARYQNDDILPVSHYDNESSDNSHHLLNEVPLHDLEGAVPDPTSESGQMIIDKTRHLHTLLLAFYYNYYGPKWYFKMFSQGTSGEGDKESFLSAAHVLGLPYYQVNTDLEHDGFNHEELGYQGLGLLQMDFEQDYIRHQEAKSKIHQSIDKYSKFASDYTNEWFRENIMDIKNHPLDVLFIHASFYKFNPWQMYQSNQFLDASKQHVRGFRRLTRYGFDFELEAFRMLRNHLCGTETIKFKYLEDKINKPEWPEVCRYLSEHTAFLENTHEEALSGKL